jgi:hypothetical protein
LGWVHHLQWVLNTYVQTISDNELRLRQIDSDIERLNKQRAYLHRVQYAALVDEQALKSRVK